MHRFRRTASATSSRRSSVQCPGRPSLPWRSTTAAHPPDGVSRDRDGPSYRADVVETSRIASSRREAPPAALRSAAASHRAWSVAPRRRRCALPDRVSRPRLVGAAAAISKRRARSRSGPFIAELLPKRSGSTRRRSARSYSRTTPGLFVDGFQFATDSERLARTLARALLGPAGLTRVEHTKRRKGPVSRPFPSGACRDRTGDLQLAKLALSQLS
jgi:hypothetical protein